MSCILADPQSNIILDKPSLSFANKKDMHHIFCFCSELLDKVQRELDKVPRFARDGSSKFLENLFQGQLVSQASDYIAAQLSGVIRCFLPGPEIIKLFSSSAQLSMKFQLLINVEIVKISG